MWTLIGLCFLITLAILFDRYQRDETKKFWDYFDYYPHLKDGKYE